MGMGKKAPRRRLGLPLGQMVILLTLPLLAFLAFSAGKKGLEAYTLWQQAEELRREIEQLKSRNSQLRQEIEYLRSDAYVEKVAREELDMIKPGDVAIVVVYPTAIASPTFPDRTPTPTPTPVPRSQLPGWLEGLSSLLTSR